MTITTDPNFAFLPQGVSETLTPFVCILSTVEAKRTILAGQSYKFAVEEILKDWELVRGRFDRISNVWIRETSALSSGKQIRAHHSFRELVDFGNTAIPWAKERLAESARWGLVLEAITGASPAISNPGDAKSIAAAWLNWEPNEAAAA